MSADASEVGRVNIVIDELGPGWLRFRAVLASDFQREVELERFPGLIDRTLTDFFRKRPGLKVRATMPIVEDGFTVAVHVWFDPA